MFNSDERAFRLARKSFSAFCLLVYPGFEIPAHIAYLIAICEQVLAGKLRRVAAFLPPRNGKSLLIAILFVAYYLGRNPKAQVILGTYSAELAESWGRRIRAILQSENFQHIFPECQLDPSSSAAGRFNTLQGGQFIGVGREGAMTGFGGDLVILDDLIKNEQEANSDVVCNSVIEWLKHVVWTRLTRKSAVFMISTRWSEKDPGGFVAREPGWKVVRIPAISEGANVDPLHRPAGEALWPSKFPVESLAEIRLAVGGTVWNSLYQGNPGAAQGQIFKRSWFNHYTARPERFTRIVQSWDTAFKSGSSNDYSVCTTWGECDSGYYLLHLWRGKPEFPELKRQFCSLAARWRPHSVTVEDKASGQSLIQELRVSTPFPVKPIKIDADKITRASSITGYFEAGKIFFPEGAPFTAELEDELAAFPNGAHDDQVDSVSQAINFLRESGGVLGLVEYIKGLASGIFRLDPEPEFSAPEPVDQHAVELLRVRMEAEREMNIPSNPHSAVHQNAATEKLACPRCGTSYSIVPISVTEKKCNNCNHQWGSALAGQQERHSRFELRKSEAQFYAARERFRGIVARREGETGGGEAQGKPPLGIVAGIATPRKHHSLILPYRFELIREVAA